MLFFERGKVIQRLAINNPDKSKVGIYAPIIIKTNASAVETADKATILPFFILTTITTQI